MLSGRVLLAPRAIVEYRSDSDDASGIVAIAGMVCVVPSSSVDMYRRLLFGHRESTATGEVGRYCR